jgi:hypothetical protein
LVEHVHQHLEASKGENGEGTRRNDENTEKAGEIKRKIQQKSGKKREDSWQDSVGNRKSTNFYQILRTTCDKFGVNK